MVESCRKKSCDRNKPVLVCWAKRAPGAFFFCSWMLMAQFTEHCPCELWSPLYFCLPLPPSLEIGWLLPHCLGVSGRGTAGCTEITRGRFSRNVGLTMPASAHCCLGSSILPAAAASTGASSRPLLAFQALILGAEPAAPRCIVQQCSSHAVAFLPRRC